MPLCRCMGEVIVLSGLIFLMKGCGQAFRNTGLQAP